MKSVSGYSEIRPSTYPDGIIQGREKLWSTQRLLYFSKSPYVSFTYPNARTQTRKKRNKSGWIEHTITQTAHMWIGQCTDHWLKIAGIVAQDKIDWGHLRKMTQKWGETEKKLWGISEFLPKCFPRWVWEMHYIILCMMQQSQRSNHKSFTRMKLCLHTDKEQFRMYPCFQIRINSQDIVTKMGWRYETNPWILS